MKTIPLTFRFKGHRTYVQGPDLYDGILGAITELHPAETLRQIKLTIHSFADKQGTLILSDPDEVGQKPEQALAEMTVKTEQGKVLAWLLETEQPINESYEFDEARIEALCQINDDEITISGDSGYSAIEVAVSMTKQLHNKLFPVSPEKWIVVGVNLSRVLKPSDGSSLQIKFKQNFNNNKLTKSNLIVDDQNIGHIFFSAVTR